MKKNKIWDKILNTLIVLMAVYLITFWFILGRYPIDGQSMEPTLHHKDKVITSRFTSNLKRFDILAVDINDTQWFHKKISVVKRLVGLPHEKVELKQGQLYINDKLVKQNFTYNHDETSHDWGTLKDNEYVVLGDNRPHSGDSRLFGKIKHDTIFGKIISKSWF